MDLEKRTGQDRIYLPYLIDRENEIWTRLGQGKAKYKAKAKAGRPM